MEDEVEAPLDDLDDGESAAEEELGDGGRGNPVSGRQLPGSSPTQ